MKKVILITLLLTGCAGVPYKSGATVTGSVSAPLTHAQTTTQQVLQSGAVVNDPKVVSIAKDLTTAQTSLVVVTKVIDSQNEELATDKVTIAAKNHRILIDDIIFAIPLAIVAGMIFFQIAKVVAL